MATRQIPSPIRRSIPQIRIRLFWPGATEHLLIRLRDLAISLWARYCCFRIYGINCE